jgi:multiple sugar transport system permease protein
MPGTVKWIGASLIRLVFVLFFLFPIYWIGAMSFMTNQTVLSFPPHFTFSPTLQNYVNLLSGSLDTSTGSLRVHFLHNMLNSFILAAGSTLAALTLAVPASYAFARYKFRGSDSMSFTVLSVRFAPPLLVLIPLLREFHATGLYDSYLSLIWVYLLITIPLILWITRGYFEQISADLEAAYRLDGHNWWQTFYRIALPLARPGIAAAGLLTFIYAWNNFIFALVLGSQRIQPVTVSSLSFITSTGIQYGSIAAALILSIVPTLLIALYAQRHLVQGLAVGATKG